MYYYLTIMGDYAIGGHHQFEDPRFCISSLRGWYRTGPGGIDQRHRGWIISFDYGDEGILTKDRQAVSANMSGWSDPSEG